MGIYEAQVISQTKVNDSSYLLKLHSPEIAQEGKPGQFIHLKCSSSVTPLLRRPFSIHNVEKSTGNIVIYYAVVGEGTKLLNKAVQGEKLSVMGPLGKGFTIPEEKKIALIGGGLGIAPLLFLAEELVRHNNCLEIFLGGENKDSLNIKDYFHKFSASLHLATDDGSLGNKGFITDIFKEKSSDDLDYIFSCGPQPMLKEVKSYAESREIKCQVSLESKMACGVGACLGCVCEGKDNNYYPKVCSDGPVFWSEEVTL